MVASGDEDEDSESEAESEPVLTGKQKRAAQKTTRRETSSTKKSSLKAQKPKKGVSFAPYTKAGAKAKQQPKSGTKPQASSEPSSTSREKKRRTATPAPARVGNVGKKAAKAEGGDDAYDFSKYF